MNPDPSDQPKNTETVSVRADKSLKDRLQKRVTELNWSESQFVRKAIRKALDEEVEGEANP